MSQETDEEEDGKGRERETEENMDGHSGLDEKQREELRDSGKVIEKVLEVEELVEGEMPGEVKKEGKEELDVIGY